MKTDLGSKAKDPPRGAAADADFSPASIASIGRKLGEDADLRRDLQADPRAAFAERGVDVPPGVELRVAANTGDTFHLVFPADPNEALADETLGAVSGGRASTAGSIGSASTASTIPSCWGSASSTSTIGSIAS